MKKLFLVSLVAICIIVFDSVNSTSQQSAKNYKDVKLRKADNTAFSFGEKLTYNVGFKYLSAGTGYFHVQQLPAIINGRQCYDIRFQVKSNPSFEWLYTVRDTYSSMVDIDGVFPWRFEQHVREGNYKYDFAAIFDQVTNKAYVNKEEYNIYPYTHDIVSALYYVRTLDINSMRKDSVFYLRNFFKDTTHVLGVKMLGRQTIEVEAGKFKCIVIEPLVRQGGLFKHEGNLFVWLTDDEKRIPVKVSTKIIIGSVGAELISYSGINGKIKAKIE